MAVAGVISLAAVILLLHATIASGKRCMVHGTNMHGEIAQRSFCSFS